MRDFDLPTHPTLFHPVTGAPLTAVGVIDGRPVWPILGAGPEEDKKPDDDEDGSKGGQDSSEDDAADDDEDEGGADSDGGEDKPLGPAGQKAYEAEKARRREAGVARRTAEKEAADLRAELARMKSGAGDDEAAQARQQAVDEAISAATKKANDRILRSEVQRLATGKVANPAVALKLLDLSQFEVDDDGNVDDDEIGDAIAELIKKEPYLAAQGRRFQGDADGGPRNRDQGNKKPPQVTEEQLKTLTPDEIVKAQKEGRLADLLG